MNMNNPFLNVCSNLFTLILHNKDRPGSPPLNRKIQNIIRPSKKMQMLLALLAICIAIVSGVGIQLVRPATDQNKCPGCLG